MQSICRMLLKAYMLGGDYQYLFFFFFVLGLHPCIPPHTWSLEWGEHIDA